MRTLRLARVGSWPEVHGVPDPASVPEGIWQQHLVPFRRGKPRASG